MLTQPRKVKYRKTFKGKNRGDACRGTTVDFGQFGLQALENGFVTDKQIEAARKKITFATKKSGKYWIRIFPHKPLTKKPVGVKMGGGKGDIKQYTAVVRKGHVMFEIDGVTREVAKEAFRKAGHKISIKTTMVEK